MAYLFDPEALNLALRLISADTLIVAPTFDRPFYHDPSLYIALVSLVIAGGTFYVQFFLPGRLILSGIGSMGLQVSYEGVSSSDRIVSIACVVPLLLHNTGTRVKSVLDSRVRINLNGVDIVLPSIHFMENHGTGERGGQEYPRVLSASRPILIPARDIQLQFVEYVAMLPGGDVRFRASSILEFHVELMVDPNGQYQAFRTFQLSSSEITSSQFSDAYCIYRVV